MFSLFIEDLYKNVNIYVNMNSESIFLIFTYLNLTDQYLSLRQVKIVKSMCSIYIYGQTILRKLQLAAFIKSYYIPCIHRMEKQVTDYNRPFVNCNTHRA